MSNSNKPDVNIDCPNCGVKIDVDEILYHKLDTDLKQRYKVYSDELQEKYATKEKEYQALLTSVEERSENIDKEVKSHVQQQLKSKEAELRTTLKAEIQDEASTQLNLLKEELTEKNEKLKELNTAKAAIERLKREKDTLREEIKLEEEKKLTAILQEEREKIAKTEHDKNELKIAEKEKVINQLKEQMEDMKRKADSASQQLQGEVQELAIEQYLRSEFPQDEIKEIKKGALGGDCIQIVFDKSVGECGMIYYESKRTKTFEKKWIEKFKNDIRDKNANVGVLVTATMPNDVDRMTLIDNIWVCSFDEFKGLSKVLRQNIVSLGMALASQENKGDKMVMLYDFLTSNEFKLQIEGIVEGFTQLKTDLEKEKRSMNMLWKQREKQIDKVLNNTTHMYGSIKGIAGSAISPIASLELPEAPSNGELFD